MATEPDYFYTPIYGVEEYDALGVPSSDQFGGGAKRTNDNLMRSLWGDLVEDQDTGFFTGGALLKPQYAFGGDWSDQPFSPNGQKILDLPNVGLKSTRPSRYSARFHLNPSSPKAFSMPVMAFLKPPQEFLQDFVRALALDEDGNLVFKKSVLDAFLWNQYSYVGDLGLPQGPAVGIFGFSALFGINPFYLGDGSDGVFPTPLITITQVATDPNADKQGLINALNKSDFSVSVIIGPDLADEPHMHTIEYPHSIGRG